MEQRDLLLSEEQTPYIVEKPKNGRDIEEPKEARCRLHTQEVTGSSTVAFIINFNQLQTEGRVGESGCDVDCDVRSQFAFLGSARRMVSGWLVAEGPSIRPLSSFS